jgi:hypothetical protein
MFMGMRPQHFVVNLLVFVTVLEVVTTTSGYVAGCGAYARNPSCCQRMLFLGLEKVVC